MLKIFSFFVFVLLPVSLFADNCVKYKTKPNIDIINPKYQKKVIQPIEPMDKYHGNVVATFIEDYDIVVDIIPENNGYCVVMKSVNGVVGYNDFTIKIDKSNRQGTCSYNAILNHEYKHINAYLSVVDDMSVDLKDSVFNAANSVMPVFVEYRDNVDNIIEDMNNQMQNHPELILMKQKINAAQEIRNKRIDQNETNEELNKC
jgi:hypothetical protein